MVSGTKRISEICIMVKGVIIFKHEDGKYGNSKQRERLDLMESLVDFLCYENFTERGSYYKQINEMLKEAKIDGALCLAL